MAKTLAKNCPKQIQFKLTAVLVVYRALDDLLFIFFFFSPRYKSIYKMTLPSQKYYLKSKYLPPVLTD